MAIDKVEAMTIADWIVVMMNGGHVELVGRSLDLCNDPHSIFVAEFIGSLSMNLLRGSSHSADGRPVFKSSDGIMLPLLGRVSMRSGIGTRSEHLTVAPAGSGIPARIVVVKPLGPETHVTATVGEQIVVRCFTSGSTCNLTRPSACSCRPITSACATPLDDI